jgi:hypothetical protein
VIGKIEPPSSVTDTCIAFGGVAGAAHDDSSPGLVTGREAASPATPSEENDAEADVVAARSSISRWPIAITS